MARSEEALERRAEYNTRWWREHGPAYNRAHPRRATALPPISRTAVLAEDVAQQCELARLSHRRADNAEAYATRERKWIFESGIPIVTREEAMDGLGVYL